MIIFLLFQLTLEQCLVNQDAQMNFFKQNNEIIKINLFDYFYGYNLEFQAEGQDIQNVLNQLDNIENVGSIVDSSLLVSQFSKEWFNLVAILIQNNSAYTIQIFVIQDNNLIEKQSLYIPQSQYQISCNQIAFIDDNNIIIDCNFINQNGSIQNQFYISSLDNEFSWQILNYNSTFNQFALYETELEVAINNSSDILITKGSYYDVLVGIVEIYSFAGLETQQQVNPIQVFNSTYIRQFKIKNYELYLMNVTRTVQVFSLNNFQQIKSYNLSSYFDPRAELLAFDIETEDDTILVYNNMIGENLYEITSSSLIRKYIVRIDFTLTSIPQLYSNPELIGLQIDNMYFIYDRLRPNVIINSQKQTLVNLNQLPYNILTYDNQDIFYYQILQPSFFINSQTNASINITATSNELNGEIFCQVQLRIIMHSITPSISSYNETLPGQLIVKQDNLYFNALRLVSGSLLEFAAAAEEKGVLLWNPSIQSQLSSQIWEQVAGVFSFYSADFNSYALFVLKYEYIKEVIKYSQISLRLCDIYTLNDYIDIEQLQCTEYLQVFSLNAPITKLQFTDLTDPDEVYFVANIANSAVVIYKLTQFNAFSQIQANFQCEPLPIDENNYFHIITDYYVVGSYLYFILSRVQQVWIYDISTCDKLFVISNEFVDDQPFFPKSLAGITVFDEENKLRQIIFVNSISYIYILEMINKLPVYQNVVKLDAGSTILSITVIRDTIIAVVKDKFGISSIFQYYYSIDQPTNEIVFIKKLPQFGVGISDQNIVAADDQLFYILMKNNFYYVYNPRLSAQECLLYQLDYIGNYISSAFIPNLLKQSMVTVASHTNIALYSLTNPILISATVLETANITQKSLIEYLISFTSPIASNQVNLAGSIIAYDTLFEAKIDYEIVEEQNNITDTITISSDSVFLELNLQEALQNNVISYFLDNILTQNNLTSHTLFSPLNSMMVVPATPLNIKQMTFNPNSNEVYVQSLTGIYSLENTTFSIISSFYYQPTHCSSLSFDPYSSVLLSLCSQYQEYTLTLITPLNGSVSNYQLSNIFYFPLKTQYLSNIISILAIRQGERSYQILLGSISNNTYVPTLNISCIIMNAQQVNGGDVGDYFMAYLNGVYLLLYTCPSLQQIQYATISANGLVVLNQSIFHLPIPLPKVTLQEIILIGINSENLSFIVSTKEFYSLIISTNYSLSNEYITLSQASQNKQIAPMQYANQERNIIYYNGFMFAVYYDATHNNFKLALYDLSNPDLNVYYSIDAITFNYPIQYAITGQANYLYVMQSAPPIYMYNYTNVVGIQLNNASYDATILGLNIFQQYGPPQVIPLNFYYPIPGATDDWVKYTCIGIGSLYVLSLIGAIIFFGYLKKKASESDDQLSMELNQR